MKKIVSVFIAFIILSGLFTGLVFAEEPTLKAESAILIDQKTGNVLFEKDADKKMFPASTTKIMTALIALQEVAAGNLSLEQPITYTETAHATITDDSSSISLLVGEEMKLDDLLKGLLIASGNDAAAIIAEYIGEGSIDSFVVKMNEKVKELGLEDTHFANPHGLQDEENYTTAYDMAKIAREAMKDATFRSIVECAHIRIPATNMSEERYYINTNNLVSRMRYADYFYDKATGIKTGHTEDAGHCLVSSAKDGDKEVIAVVFKEESISDSHTDSKNLLEYGLNDFDLVRLAKVDDIYGEVRVKQAAGGADHILLSAKDNLEILFPDNADPAEVEAVTEIPENVYAPIKKGQEIGKVNFVYNSQVIGSVPLVSTTEVKRHVLGFLMSFGEWIWGFRTVKIVVYTFFALLILFIILVIIGFSRALKKSKSKKRRRTSYRPPRY